jgi:hypothetical protein
MQEALIEVPTMRRLADIERISDRIPDEAKSLTMRTPVARWPHCLRGGSPSVASSREGPAPAAPLNGTNIR